MRDRLFFPATVILALVMFALAVWPGVGRLHTGPVTGLPEQHDLITVDGANLNKLVAGGDSVVELRQISELNYVAEIRANGDALDRDPRHGPHFFLGGDVQTALAGFRVKCTVWVKSATEDGAQEVALRYFIDTGDKLTWHTAPVGPDYAAVSFVFNMPSSPDSKRTDYLAVRPFGLSRMQGLVIQRVEFERLNRWANAG